MPRCITPRYAAVQVLREVEKASKWHDERLDIIFKEEDWELGQSFKKRSPSEILDASSMWQLSRDHHRMGYVVSLLKSLVVSAAEQEKLLRIRLDAIASKLSKGLSSLPNEILGYIFKFATQHKIKGTRHAAWLSQVSRRFRGIVLGDRSLWSTLNLWYDTTKEEVERIVSRSGEELDLHVVVNQNDKIGGPDVCTFLNGLTHTTSRWRTFTVTGDWIDDDDSIPMDVLFDNLIYAYRGLTLPKLEEICISECHYDDFFNELVSPARGFEVYFYRDNPPWVTPNLHTLRCTDYIPYTPFPFTSMSLFALSLTLIPDELTDQFRKLVAFLNAMTNLTDIDLGLKNYKDAADELKETLWFILLCPAVTSFRLHITDFNSSNGINRVLAPLITAIQMRSLERLSVFIESHDGDLYGSHSTGSDPPLLSYVLRVILPRPCIHSLLTSLDVELSLPKRESKAPETLHSANLVIPLDRIPNVSSLTVTAFSGVTFSRQPSSRSVDKLLELQLRSCEDMDIKSFEATIQSLKDVDAWDKLDSIVVQQCDLLNCDAVSAVVGMKRLQFI